MADSIFWHDMATEFERLAPCDIDVTWQFKSGDLGGYAYEIHSPSELLRGKFKVLARKAGAEVDPGKNKDSIKVWLEELRTHDKNPRNKSALAGPEVGSGNFYQTGQVPNAVEASASRCLQLQLEAEERSERAESTPDVKLAVPNQEANSFGEDPTKARGDRRKTVIVPILKKMGLSNFDWATTSSVDPHTVNDYLSGSTKPYRSTRKKLAESLGLKPEDLPE